MYQQLFLFELRTLILIKLLHCIYDTYTQCGKKTQISADQNELTNYYMDRDGARFY